MKSALLISTAIIGTTSGFAPTQITTRTPTSLSFFGTTTKSKSVKSSPLADEAVDLYTARYDNIPTRKFFFDTWGMPPVYRERNENASSESIFKRKNDSLVATFNTIASLYGEEEALKMVKIQPGILAFNKDNFGPSLTAFGENFGIEEAKEMVIRNPGLLSVKPANAETADDLTMQLSYVVEVTRPIGNFGPAAIIGLLSVPAIESATGLTISPFN